MKKESYITVLSTENYLKGVLALSESLKRTNAKYPLTVLITNNISYDTENKLKEYGLNVIRRENIEIPELIKNKNDNGSFSHWNNTFDKLLIFELTQFDKLVYLDSDMYVRKNIDELFQNGHMSATIDRKCGPKIDYDRIVLTSGLMVIEPKEGLIPKFMKVISEIIDKRNSIGDQDILQEYDTEWNLRKQLHLDIKYNMFFSHLDYYTHYGNYSLEDIKVIHFIYSNKPFYYERNEMDDYLNYIEEIKKNNYEKNRFDYLKKCLECGNEHERKVLQEYYQILEFVKAKS